MQRQELHWYQRRTNGEHHCKPSLDYAWKLFHSNHSGNECNSSYCFRFGRLCVYPAGERRNTGSYSNCDQHLHCDRDWSRREHIGDCNRYCYCGPCADCCDHS